MGKAINNDKIQETLAELREAVAMLEYWRSYEPTAEEVANTNWRLTCDQRIDTFEQLILELRGNLEESLDNLIFDIFR